jgi:hypothetical protein
MISLKWDQLNCLHSVETIASSAITSAKRIMWCRFLVVKPWNLFHGQIGIAVGPGAKGSAEYQQILGAAQGRTPPTKA